VTSVVDVTVSGAVPVDTVEVRVEPDTTPATVRLEPLIVKLALPVTVFVPLKYVS
jgi:hypothetical protein